MLRTGASRSRAGMAVETEAIHDAEAVFASDVRASLRRNYAAHLCHGLLGQTGMRLINAPTFIPAYVFALSGSELAVGVARGLQYLGMFLSPIVGATIIEHRRRVLPVAFFAGERLGAVEFLSPRLPNYATLALLWSITVPLLICLSDRLALDAAGKAGHCWPLGPAGAKP